MNILKRIFGKKEAPKPATPKSFTVELEFNGTNNRVVKVVHKGVKTADFFTVLSNGTIRHRIDLADGGVIMYREYEGHVLTKVEKKYE